MSQIVPGIVLGRAAGGGIVYIFRGAYDPNAQTVFGGQPPIPLQTISLGSLFLRTDTGTLYVKSSMPNTWSAK
jgi:hypothetical protein